MACAHTIARVSHGVVSAFAQRVGKGGEGGQGRVRLGCSFKRVVAIGEATLLEATVGRGRDVTHELHRVAHLCSDVRSYDRGLERLFAAAIFAT